MDVTGLPRIRGKQAPFGGWEKLGKAAAVQEKQEMEQQDRGRTERWSKKCHGRDGQACTFGKNGKALRGSYGHRQCLWCSPERLVDACDRRASRGGLVKSFKNMSEEQQRRAVAVVPEKFRAYFEEVASKQWR